MLEVYALGITMWLAIVSGNGQSPAVDVDRVFAPVAGPDTPGCSVGVSRDGETVYERGYGMANLEVRVPITPASVFHVASVSKQFTAMSVMLLVERGQLSLDDNPRRYIPELADYGGLTIRHLLTHTGGLRDVFLLRELASPVADSGDPNASLVALIARQRGLNFAPGSEYQYSNAGYILLAEIVRRLSGKPFGAFAAENIFKPLGMNDTHVHEDPTMVVSQRASGYTRRDGRVRIAVRADPGGLVGNTGVFTTTADLLRWERNFETVRVGDPALLAAMQALTPLTTGGSSPYGFGLSIEEHRGLLTVGHGGYDPGFTAHVVRYPDRRLAIAVLCNQDTIDPAGLARAVADVYLGAEEAAPSAGAARSPAPPLLSAADLAGKAGLYRDPSTELLLRMFVRDGKLMGSSGARSDNAWEVVPESATRFAIPGTSIALEFDRSDRPQRMRVIGERPTPEVFERLEPASPTPSDLQAFAGRYVNREIDVTYTLTPRGGTLALQIPGRPDIVLHPIFSDGFEGELVKVVTFTRGPGRVVTGLSVNTRGVRRLRFDRETH